jgi:hypothetical protein
VRWLLIVLTVILSLVFTGCEETVVDLAADDPVLMGIVEEPLSVDGSIDGYPAESGQVPEADILLAHDGNLFYVHMKVEGTGWVAVGINTEGNKDGANIIFGYMSDGSPAFQNDVGEGISSHNEVEAGVLEEFHLSHDNGSVVMEFSYPLNFPEGEGFNIDELVPGETYTMIFSMHSDSNDISQMHTAMGSFEFMVEP